MYMCVNVNGFTCISSKFSHCAIFTVHTQTHRTSHVYSKTMRGSPIVCLTVLLLPFRPASCREQHRRRNPQSYSSQKSALFTNNKYIIECHSVIRDLEILTQELRVVCVCVRTCTRITPQAAGHKIASVSFLAICENLSGYDK